MKAGFCFFVTYAALSAQWLNHPTPGLPRTPDGKPNLSAPAPRTADNKPELGGLWAMNPGPYGGNIATDLKPEDVQPWADALVKQRAAAFSRDDPAQFSSAFPKVLGPIFILSTWRRSFKPPASS